jgi:hypothetical protein
MDGGKPLVLVCGHTFCEKCLEENYRSKDKIKCFECKEDHRDLYKSVADVAINFDLLKISHGSFSQFFQMQLEKPPSCANHSD